jgi:hypothetical protein
MMSDHAKRERFHLRQWAVGLLVVAVAAPALAHVVWRRSNRVDPSVIAIYRFSDQAELAAKAFKPAGGLSDTLVLQVARAGADAIGFVEQVASPPLGPGAATFTGPVIAATVDEFEGAAGDLTIELWYRFDRDSDSGFEFGFEKGPRVHVMRGKENEAMDMFMLVTTGGTPAMSAPEFFGWASLYGGDAQIGGWRHVAIAIHSTGLEESAETGGTVYKEGSAARFWWYGHNLGEGATVDLTGARADEKSRLVLRNMMGKIAVDEISIWKKDWSEQGQNPKVFDEGHGSGRLPDGRP